MRCFAASLAIAIGVSFYPLTDLLAKSKSRTPRSGVEGRRYEEMNLLLPNTRGW